MRFGGRSLYLDKAPNNGIHSQKVVLSVSFEPPAVNMG